MKSSYDIILAPIITEKAVEMMEDKKYTFKVRKDCNKFEIKNAIEKVFDGVKVKSVNTISVKGKTRRHGMRVGKSPDWKKAIVTLASDSKEIEFFEGL